MSINALSWGIKQKIDTPTTKLLLIILANYADERGSCYPSEKHLSKIVGVSDRQIRRCLTWLSKNNFLHIDQRTGTSNRYFLHITSDVQPPMDTSVHPLRTPTSTNTKDKTKDLYTKDFNKFWDIYPRKIGKHNASKSFHKSLKDIDAKQLIIITQNFAEQQKNTEEKYIPHAQTWLNGKRYLDVDKRRNNTKNNLAG